MGKKRNQKLELEAERKIYDVTTWLNIHITQLAYFRNLLIIMSFAEIGYVVNYFDKTQNHISNEAWWLFISMVINIISIGIGLLLAWRAQENFRLKRKISRILVKNDDILNAKDEYKIVEKECEKLESGNRIYIKLQVLTFGVATLIISFKVFNILFHL